MDNLTGERTALKYFAEPDRTNRDNLSESLVKWNGESHEYLPKDVLSVANKTHFGVLQHKHTNIILESWMVGYVSFMQKCGKRKRHM